MTSKKNKKRVKNEPVHWDELKKPRTINLTDKAWNILERESVKEGISRSELIERWARSLS